MAVTFAALKKRLQAERAAGGSPGGGGFKESGIATSTTTSSLPFQISPDGIKLSLSSEQLQECVVGSIPQVRYIPNVVTPEIEKLLLDAVDLAGDRGSIMSSSSSSSTAPRWVALRNRRLQQYGGKPTPNGLVDPEPLPLWLEAIIDGLMSAGVFPSASTSSPSSSSSSSSPSSPPPTTTTTLRPNHVLVNEYLPGQGIFPHTDGPSYYPVVATLSLGSEAIMRYQPRGSSTSICAEVVLRTRSLVITSQEAYEAYMHSLAEVESEIVGETSGAPCVNLASAEASVGELIERGRRISLTIRHVPNRKKTENDAKDGGEEGESKI